ISERISRCVGTALRETKPPATRCTACCVAFWKEIWFSNIKRAASSASFCRSFAYDIGDAFHEAKERENHFSPVNYTLPKSAARRPILPDLRNHSVRYISSNQGAESDYSISVSFRSATSRVRAKAIRLQVFWRCPAFWVRF